MNQVSIWGSLAQDVNAEVLSAIENSDKESLKKGVQMYSFALNDLTLYLDTHPTDTAAMYYYRIYRELLNATQREYSKRYGPLFGGETVPNEVWSWATEPFPWN